MDESWSEILPDSAAEEAGVLSIGGCRMDALAEHFGTPLYIYDEATLRNVARRVLRAFARVGARVSFASKACSTLGVLRILCEEGLGLDAVSGGELEAALRAGFSPARVHLHGNCKSEAELDAAARLGVHSIVVDNLEELEQLERICARRRVPVRVMLRITLAFEGETHPHLQTSGRRSKFGLFHTSQEEEEAVSRLARSPMLQLVGVHSHLGSQLQDAGLYRRAASQLHTVATSLRARSFPIEEFSVGGGWAVAYRPGDTSLSPESVAGNLQLVADRQAGIRPAVEPGRALVARAGVAVYRAGSTKQMGTYRVVAVDGGLGDNPRPALYGSRYSAFLPLRLNAPIGLADIVGRYCESGDVLVRDALLPSISAGDLICIPMSGAYQLSMASSYNLVPQPAVVLVREGHARLLTRRASIDDLFAREMTDQWHEQAQPMTAYP